MFEELRGAGVDSGAVAFYLGRSPRKPSATTRRSHVIVKSTTESAVGCNAADATVLAKKGDVDGARRYLASLKPESRDDASITAADAQVLRDAGDYKGAYAVLSSALAGEPNSAELIYDVAMVAEKLERLDEVEAQLTRLIELKPDNAQALKRLATRLSTARRGPQKGLSSSRRR